MDAKPSGRLLTGHSSGGWATLWLQVAYPRLFGGVWSTSPDPVDFRDFTNIDLTRDAKCKSGRMARPRRWCGCRGAMSSPSRNSPGQEKVLGDMGGGADLSFDWVFSPRGPDGRPMPLFDRETGVVHREMRTLARALRHFTVTCPRTPVLS